MKHIAEQASGAGGTTLQLACFCAQHSTGTVIEGVTRRLGILTPTFNTALSLKRASFQRRAREEIRRLLVERLVIMAELPAVPADGHSRALLAEFFVSEASDDGVTGRQALADRFLDFFPASLEGQAVEPTACREDPAVGCFL